MTEPVIEPTPEPTAGSATITDVQQLQQLLRQAEVDGAYWRGHAEALEKELRLAQGGSEVPAAAPAAQSAPAFSPEKLLPLLVPILSNPDILKMLLPLLKNLSAPRQPTDG
jgi:outer membrane protein TolC